MPNKSREFNEGVRRLAQYRPFEAGGLRLEGVLRDLVLAAADINGGGFKNLAECQAALKSLWTIDVEIEEIRSVRDALASDGLADKKGGGIQLHRRVLEDLEKRSETSQVIEEKALAQWDAITRELRPDLTADDLEDLRDDLREWLGKIVARHGAEAALMLYPDEPRAHQLFDEIEKFGTSFLPERRAEVMAVRERALKQFVRQPTSEQEKFLANRLNTGFYLTVLTLDPAARQLVEERAKNVYIYLDTNVLYAILGMAPPEEVLAAKRLLELSRNLGYHLVVTPWTITEMHKSIERARKNVEIHGRTFNTGIGRLMVKVTGEKGATRTYWEQFLKLGLSVDDFFAKIAAFEDALPGFGIETSVEGCERVEKLDEQVEEYAPLLRQIVWPRERHPEVIDHDVRHRLLIERLRGEGTPRFSRATRWFLTQDTKLPTFAKMVPDPDQKPPELPFCISPSAWVQIVRAMTPRTDNFEEMVVELLASPYVGYEGPVNPEAVRAVVARMDLHDEDSEEIALAVVQDSALMSSVEEAGEAEIEERVRYVYAEKAKELKKQAEDSAQIAADEQAAKERAEGRELETRQDLEAERRRREGLESDLRRSKEEQEAEARKFDDRFSAEQEARKKAEDDQERRIKALQERLDNNEESRRRNRRIFAGALIALVGLLGPALALLFGAVKGTLGVIAVVIGGALMLAVSLNLLLGEKKGSTVLNVLAYLIGIAGLVLAIAAESAS